MTSEPIEGTFNLLAESVPRAPRTGPRGGTECGAVTGRYWPQRDASQTTDHGKKRVFARWQPIAFGREPPEYPLGESNPCCRTENPES